MGEYVRRRTLARQVALQFMYMCDVNGEHDIDSLDAFVRDKYKDDGILEFSRKLVGVAFQNADLIDAWIRFAAENWKITRMPIVDRNVMRLAVAEMLSGEQTPMQVIINEAIEIARRFSAEESGTFVNGILDRVANTMATGFQPSLDADAETYSVLTDASTEQMKPVRPDDVSPDDIP